MDAHNIRAHKYIKQILTNTDNNIIIVRNFNTPHTQWIDPLRKINKERVYLNNTLDHIGLDTLSKATDYTLFFKCIWNILQDQYHVRPKAQYQYILKDWNPILHLF